LNKTFLRLVQISCIVMLSLFNIFDMQNLRTLLLPPGYDEYKIRMKQHLLCLMMAYPEHIVDIKCSDDDNVYLIMKSGAKLLYDDKKNKSLNEKIANPDLQDMMEQIYPLGSIDKLMDVDFDPGRVRIYPLLKEVYGANRQQVVSNLGIVKTDYLNIKFNKSNNAAKALEAVMAELLPLAESRPDIKACVLPFSGTFYYRKIAGTDRLSPHAFGIAIDLAIDKRDYWQWTSREKGEERLKSYPQEIVHIFEKNNFIWGGKWGHFDILHFEYRPEIIMMATYFGNRRNTEELWYEGAPMDNALTMEYIKKIDEVIR